MRAVTLGTGLIFVGLMLPLQANGGEKEVAIVRMTQVARAPASIQLQVRVEPRADNRRLRVTLDSASFYRSTELTLEGARSPATHWIRWEGIPADTYSVVAEVHRSNGDHRVTTGGHVAVIGTSAGR